MSYVIAAVGFMLLIVLHELGHFAVAKWVGMRVERFSLFFPPFVWRRQGKGETEYTIGAIPLGGYVKISGMNPHEKLPPEVAHRAYYRQKPWKRTAVILAGPAVNIVLAFVILAGIVLHTGVPSNKVEIAAVTTGSPAAESLRAGDRVLAVDGRTITRTTQVSALIRRHRCPGTQSQGCRAATPVVLTLERDGRTLRERVYPQFDAKAKRPLIGVQSGAIYRDASIGEAMSRSVDDMWFVTTSTVHVIVNIFSAEQRRQLSGVVGSYETTRAAVNTSVVSALQILALISLSLGIINLFPFLPLDGGHVFWAVAEKLRGKAIPFRVMERAGIVGFMLVIAFALIGLTNDIDRLLGPGFGAPR